MTQLELDKLARGGASGALGIYCMSALLADEASRHGFRDFANSMETAMSTLLSGLPRDQQKQALRFAYEMTLGGEKPAPPRLRLVYSRD